MQLAEYIVRGAMNCVEGCRIFKDNKELGLSHIACTKKEIQAVAALNDSLMTAMRAVLLLASRCHLHFQHPTFNPRPLHQSSPWENFWDAFLAPNHPRTQLVRWIWVPSTLVQETTQEVQSRQLQVSLLGPPSRYWQRLDLAAGGNATLKQSVYSPGLLHRNLTDLSDLTASFPSSPSSNVPDMVEYAVDQGEIAICGAVAFERSTLEMSQRSWRRNQLYFDSYPKYFIICLSDTSHLRKHCRG